MIRRPLVLAHLPPLPRRHRLRQLVARPPQLRLWLEDAQGTTLVQGWLRETVKAPGAVNQASGGPGPDRFLSPEIDAVVELVQSRRILSLAEATTGPLQ